MHMKNGNNEKNSIKDYVKKDEIVYPDDPHQHLFSAKQKKRKRTIDENYKYKPGFFTALTGAVLRPIAMIALPLAAAVTNGYTVKGRKNLKGVKGAVFVANHVHVMDCPLICSSVSFPRKTWFVTLDEVVDIPVAGFIVKSLGAVPIAGTLKGMRKFNEYLKELLVKGKRICLFPETALWPYYEKIRPFKKGAFKMASDCYVPVVPVVYTFKTTKRGRKKFVLHICPPMKNDGLAPEVFAERVRQVFIKTADEFYGRNDSDFNLKQNEQTGNK